MGLNFVSLTSRIFLEIKIIMEGWEIVQVLYLSRVSLAFLSVPYVLVFCAYQQQAFCFTSVQSMFLEAMSRIDP